MVLVAKAARPIGVRMNSILTVRVKKRSAVVVPPMQSLPHQSATTDHTLKAAELEAAQKAVYIWHMADTDAQRPAPHNAT